MKHTYFFPGILLFITINLKSQEYVPFPKSDVNWNVFYAGTCSESEMPDTLLIRYTIHGDTTINEIEYAKLCMESGDTLNPEIRAIGGLREADKKIYYIGQTILREGLDEEFLLYDFTAEINDTVWHDSNEFFYSVILDTDSVLIGDSYRKRYQVDNHWFFQNPDYIIEGIGSVNNGLLGHISDLTTCGSHYWENICFRENGIVKYLNPEFGDCYPEELLAGIEQAGYEFKFELYPNPFSKEIQLENKSGQRDLIFRLIDVSGRTLVEQLIAGEKVSIDIDVKPGIYNALVVNSKGELLLSKKLVKE